jgi:carbon monoxide dehydrogenase subunit G
MIQCPVEEVFAFMSDIENWAQVQPDSQGNEKFSGDRIEVGSTFRQALDISGQRIELLGKVIGYEPNERLSLEYTRDQLTLDVSFSFDPFDGDTRLTARGEGSIGGLVALFEPLVKSEINAQLKINLDDIKNRLELQADAR